MQTNKRKNERTNEWGSQRTNSQSAIHSLIIRRYMFLFLSAIHGKFIRFIVTLKLDAFLSFVFSPNYREDAVK